jgi:hypothetical protein
MTALRLPAEAVASRSGAGRQDRRIAALTRARCATTESARKLSDSWDNKRASCTPGIELDASEHHDRSARISAAASGSVQAQQKAGAAAGSTCEQLTYEQAVARGDLFARWRAGAAQESNDN